MTDPVGLAIRTCFPFHFGTDEFIGLKAAAKMGSISFRPHRKFRIMWTAGDPVFIQRIVWIQISGSSAERNISTAELPWRAVWKDPEGTAGKKGLVVLDAVKGRLIYLRLERLFSCSAESGDGNQSSLCHRTLRHG